VRCLTAELSNSSDIPNFPTIAAAYSQLAGLLAGFAFASLIALIVAQITVDTEAPRSLRSYTPLIAAFISLVMASLDYAVVAGDQSGTGRAAALETTAGIGFCIAGTMLLFSILTLVRGVEKDVERGRAVTRRTGNMLCAVVVFGLSPLLTALLYGGIRDSGILQHDSNSYFDPVDVFALVLFVVNVGSGSWIFFRYRAKPKHLPRLASILPIAAIAISMLSTLGVTLTLSFMERTSFQSQYLSMGEMLLLNVFSLGVSYLAVRYDASQVDDHVASTIECRANGRDGTLVDESDEDGASETVAVVAKGVPATADTRKRTRHVRKARPPSPS
jgi:hypothetical protein